jgi:hypothetical protein
MPALTRAEIKERVIHVLAKFSTIPEGQITEKDPLTRFFPNLIYSKLLFGGQVKKAFPKVTQTSFTNSLFSTSLDSVKEIIDYIKAKYPDNVINASLKVASRQDIDQEFENMRASLKNFL